MTGSDEFSQERSQRGSSYHMSSWCHHMISWSIYDSSERGTKTPSFFRQSSVSQQRMGKWQDSGVRYSCQYANERHELFSSPASLWSNCAASTLPFTHRVFLFKFWNLLRSCTHAEEPISCILIIHRLKMPLFLFHYSTEPSTDN